MILNIKDLDCISIAIDYFQRGRIVVYPTDTCYGLGTIGLKWNDKNILKIYRIKERSINKPLSLLISEEMINRYLEIPENIKRLLAEVWPGSFTGIFFIRTPQDELSSFLNVSNFQKIAFRVPDHKMLLSIIKKLGIPIIGTSANISGDNPVYNIDNLINEHKFKDVDLWIDEGTLPLNPPSTVVDFTDYSNPIILREGKVNFKLLWKQII
ncbi:L-threonylcarbamoyladenylate synthase [Candidatus Hodarchaeum mangrovi]